VSVMPRRSRPVSSDARFVGANLVFGANSLGAETVGGEGSGNPAAPNPGTTTSAARLCLRYCACDRGHGEAGGQGRDEAAAAVAHGRTGIAGDGADAAEGSAVSPNGATLDGLGRKTKGV
jgi:hypothetical protein